VTIPSNVRWPVLIIGALAIHALVSLAVVFVATSNPSYAVEEDYYQKALRWDDRRAQDRRNAELGWQVALDIRPPSSPGAMATLEMVITDRDLRSVEGATVSVEAFHNARADRILRAPLDQAGDGVYAARLGMRRSGVWEFRITAVRGDTTFTHRETRFVTLGPRK